MIWGNLEAAVALVKRIALREGFGERAAEGGAAGSVPDEDLMRKQYYKIRGLDERGFPTPQLLKLSDLEFLQKPLASV